MYIRLAAYDEGYKESLKAKTKDPLWFLVKQWQTGEFMAEDCGHPVHTEISYAELPTKTVVHGNGNTEPYDSRYPVEWYIEKGEDGGTPPDWDVSKLEYKADILFDGLRLSADGYYSGSLDWYDFIIKRNNAQFSAYKGPITDPATITFAGMPSLRYWEFENAAINFKMIERPEENIERSEENIERPGGNFLTTMVLDFSLLYGEDWYMAPLEQHVGTVRKVVSIKGTDSFDEGFTIPPVQNSPNANALNQWSMFSMTEDGKPIPDNSLFYLPNTIRELLESGAVEEVALIRDEMMNLVWAVERKYEEKGIVVNRDDESRPEALPVYREFKPVYTEKTDAPENWIPYFPVMLSGGTRVALLRGRTSLSQTGEQSSYRGKFIGESKQFNQEEVSSLTVALRRKYRLLNLGREENWDLIKNPQGSSQGKYSFKKSGGDTNKLLSWRARDKKPVNPVPLKPILFDTVE